MKWWHWSLLFLGGALFLRNKAPAVAAAPLPDSGSPLGPSLTAYLDAIQRWYVDNLGQTLGTFVVIFDAARGYIVVSYTPAPVEGVNAVTATVSEKPWSYWFATLFDPATCSEKNAAGLCKYGI